MEESTNFTRRAALAKMFGIGGLTAASHLGALPGITTTGSARAYPAHDPDAEIPITGKAAKGFEPFDEAVDAIMDNHGVVGAALAVAYEGKLVFAKGYGWMDAAGTDPVKPDTLFGLASVSKPFTAVAIMQLVEQGKFKLDDPVFDLIKHIKPPRGAKPDPRLSDITVRQCLNHSGGWDRAKTGDSTCWEPHICRALHTRPPVTAEQFVSFAMSVPLYFKPGARNEYSNIGYVVLGEVIKKVTGMAYERYIVENVMKPAGIKRMGLHKYDNKYFPNEARRHLPGANFSLPPVQLPMIDSSGGWSGSVVDLMRFCTSVDGSRGKPIINEKSRNAMLEPPPPPIKPREDGTYFGLGWDYASISEKGFGFSKEGNLPGMRTLMRRKFNGVSWALLTNTTMEYDQYDSKVIAEATADVLKLIDGLDNIPDVDYFGDYS